MPEKSCDTCAWNNAGWCKCNEFCGYEYTQYKPKEIICPHKETCLVAGMHIDCCLEFEDDIPCAEFKEKE